MLLLTQYIGRSVRGKTNDALGKLDDLIVQIGDTPYPPVTGLVVRDWRRRFFVPIHQVAVLNGAAQLSSSLVDSLTQAAAQTALLSSSYDLLMPSLWKRERLPLRQPVARNGFRSGHARRGNHASIDA